MIYGRAKYLNVKGLIENINKGEKNGSN